MCFVDFKVVYQYEESLLRARIISSVSLAISCAAKNLAWRGLKDGNWRRDGNANASGCFQQWPEVPVKSELVVQSEKGRTCPNLIPVHSHCKECAKAGLC